MPHSPTRLAADALQKVYERLIDLARKHHAHDLGSLLIGVAQPVHKDGLLAHAAEHFGNFGPAAVHEHDFYPDEIQQNDVAHDGELQPLVDHRVPAVFDDDDLLFIILDIGQCLRKDLRAHLLVIQIFHKSRPPALLRRCVRCGNRR